MTKRLEDRSKQIFEIFEKVKGRGVQETQLRTDHVLTTFLNHKEYARLLNRVTKDPCEQNINALDRAFREFYTEIRFVKYVSLVLYYESIHFGLKQKKRQNRMLLILDQPVADKHKETILEQLATNEFETEETEESLEEQISSKELYQALLTLTPKQKKVLQLTYVNQLFDKDIASRLGISQQAVSLTRRTALRKLKKTLGGVVT